MITTCGLWVINSLLDKIPKEPGFAKPTFLFPVVCTFGGGAVKVLKKYLPAGCKGRKEGQDRV